jgi:quercetin dioxygenase-like cupin family protein
MNQQAAAVPGAPSSHNRGAEDMPYVPLVDGVTFQLLSVDLASGYWVVRARFEPGVTIQRHKHTGEVHAFTTAGAWKYLEYPEINTAGSYLFEPAGSVHTLQALAENEGITEVWFAARGANLNLDDDGNVESVLDAHFILEFYLAQCEEMGLPRPDVIGG